MSARDSINPEQQATQVLVKRLVRDHIRPYLGRLIFALICMAIVAGATAANAWLMKPVIDDVFLSRNEQMLYFVALLVFGIALAKGGAAYVESVLMDVIGQRIVADLQRGMYDKVINADLAYFHDVSTGSLISRFTNDSNLLRYSVVKAITGLVKDSLTVIFLVALMFYRDWMLSLIAFVAFPLAFYPIIRIGRRMRKVSADTQKEMAELTTILEETFQGARVVKAYGMEGYETGRAGGLIERTFQLFSKAARVRAISRPVMETLGGVAIGAVILYGGLQVINGTTTPGTFFSFITALLLAYAPLKNIANLNTNLQEGLAAAQRVFAMMDIRPDIANKPDAKSLSLGDGTIRLEGVRFAYEAENAALDGVDIDVPGGKTVALVGPSGAGKSTVLNLIPRFYDVGDGRVAIDGQDVREVTLESLRSGVALVSQEIMLFDDTIRNNIAYGRPEASEADIVEAARNAGADGFIRDLPNGYDTHVGGRGLKLSGGQRQRVAIARAMLKDAPILLLDEATSALDTESERHVQAALTRLMQGRTTLVIAHRLSTIVDADLIYVLDNGKVIETGSHAELVGAEGAYARLYRLQFAGQDEAPARAHG